MCFAYRNRSNIYILFLLVISVWLCSCVDNHDLHEVKLVHNPIEEISTPSSLISDYQKEKEIEPVKLDINKTPALDVSMFPLEAVVMNVINGKQVTVEINGLEQEFVVSYLGVVIPEGEDDQMNSASDLNEYLTLGKKVTLSEVDLYIDQGQQIHAYVFCDGEFINQILIANGFALFSEGEINVSKRLDLMRSQEEAQARGMGLWDGFRSPQQSSCGTLPCFK